MAGQRYSVMPMPAIEEHTEYIEAGPITFGIEYRVLNEEEAAKYSKTWERIAAHGDINAAKTPVDAGVTIHVYESPGVYESPEVYGRADLVEHLRFDCFLDDPHYHYISHREKINEFWTLDPVAIGEPLPWALNAIKTRLPQMLARAGAPELAKRVAQADLDNVLPKVAVAAETARKLGLPDKSRG